MHILSNYLLLSFVYFCAPSPRLNVVRAWNLTVRYWILNIETGEGGKDDVKRNPDKSDGTEAKIGSFFASVSTILHLIVWSG